MSAPRVPQPSSTFNNNAVETPNAARARSMAESERLMATSRAGLNRMGANLSAARNLLNQMKANAAASGAELNRQGAAGAAAGAALAEQKARVNALAANLNARRAASRATSNSRASSMNSKYKQLVEAKLAVRGPRRVTAEEFAAIRAAAFSQVYKTDFAEFHNASGKPTGRTAGSVVRAPPELKLSNASFKDYRGGKKTRRSTRRSKRSTRRN